MPMGEGITYTVFQLNGKPAAGMMQMDGPQFQGVPPNWLCYLSVGDCDVEVARASKMGQRLLCLLRMCDVGRFSVFQDPTGAVSQSLPLSPCKEIPDFELPLAAHFPEMIRRALSVSLPLPDRRRPGASESAVDVFRGNGSEDRAATNAGAIWCG